MCETTADFMRRRREQLKLGRGGISRATVEHMPFAGHRTQAAISAHLEGIRNSRAADFGYDPQSF
jgi:hypothetical protein